MESDKSSEEAARSGESLTEHDESTESTSKCRIQPEKYDLQLVKKPNDSEKLDLLKCDWTFSRSHVFPATDVRGVSRRFNGAWLEKFVGLVIQNRLMVCFVFGVCCLRSQIIYL